MTWHVYSAILSLTILLIRFHLQFDFQIKEYLALSLAEHIDRNFSNCVQAPSGPPCNYFRNDVWGRIGVAY